MEEDLELTGNRYEWLLTIFYIAYILFEPQVLMWKILPGESTSEPHFLVALHFLACYRIA